MSSLAQQSAAYNSITGAAIAGTSLYEFGKNIQRTLEYSENKVSFIINKTVCVEFDASLQETHGIEAKATDFPVESGATISDHIVVAPLELQLVCIVSDTPTFRRKDLLRAAFTTGFSAVAGPLGVVALNAAARLATMNKEADSPSTNTFEQLILMAAGNPNASPPMPPQVFDVVTKLKRYPSMVMTSLNVPQDNTTGKALVFSMRLQQVSVVQTQTTSFAQLKAPIVGAKKAKKGEVEALTDKYTKEGKRGINAGDYVTFQEPTYKGL